MKRPDRGTERVQERRGVMVASLRYGEGDGEKQRPLKDAQKIKSVALLWQRRPLR